MYIPEHFRVRNQADALEFMLANPFAILVSATDDGPFATHLPLVIRAEGRTVSLRGHVAKANPHWRYLNAQPQCLTIFHGPHSYISPSNYMARDSVPTWNYAAVHVYGTARVFTSLLELQQMLNDLIETFDAAYRTQWEGVSQKFRDHMLENIVGFEIAATRIEGKFKLSQNRPAQDRAYVIRSLEASPDSAIAGVARMMKELKLGRISADNDEDKADK